MLMINMTQLMVWLKVNDVAHVQYSVRGLHEIGQIELINMSGQTLFQADIQRDGETNIPVHKLPKGIYHVVLRNNDSRTSKKLIVN